MRAELAEDANNAKNLFIANMSHELRTPLNAILGFSDLMLTQMLGPIGVPRYTEYLGDIKSSGSHLLNVVNNLLLFAKIEAGQHRIECEETDIESEVDSVVRLLRFDADKRQVAIRRVPSAPVGTAIADQQSLRQILINIVGNAIKFSEPNNEIFIETIVDRATGAVRIAVSDRGCGIPEKVLAELGNPFVQAEGTFSRRHQGSGLGLAICFGLADAMGATLDVISSEFDGTVVTVSLPGRAGPARVSGIAKDSEVV